MMSALAKAQFVDRAAPQAEWRFIHRIADAAYGTVYARVLRALRGITADAGALRAALASQDVVAAAQAVDVEAFAADLSASVFPLLWDVYGRAGALTARLVGRGTFRKALEVYAFRQTHPAALEWAAQHSSALITELSQEAREAVRALVVGAFQQGVPPRMLASQILQANVLGLTVRQSASIVNLQAWLRVQGFSSGAIASRVQAATQLALKQRAQVIARTETLAASNAGQLQAWEQGAAEGLVDPDFVKEWIVTPDDRLCPICESMDGQQVPMHEVFGGGVQSPPLHPSCRCAIGLVPVRRGAAASAFAGSRRAA